MSEQDGGPAFPSMVTREEMDDSDRGYRTVREPEGGMSLRDYFAGQALAGVLASGTWVNATVIYRYADWMLEERAK